MGLSLDFNIRQSDNARELSFTETTGIFNNPNNLGGWGAPNDDTNEATTVSIKVTPPDMPEVTINMLVPATGFPTTNKNLEYIIKSQDVGLDTDVELPDGIWTIKYEIVSPGEGNIPISSIQKILLSGQARCCVMKLLADVDLCDCDGTDKARALEAFTYYRMAISCALRGDEGKFLELLEIIKKYCNGC